MKERERTPQHLRGRQVSSRSTSRIGRQNKDALVQEQSRRVVYSGSYLFSEEWERSDSGILRSALSEFTPREIDPLLPLHENGVHSILIELNTT